MHDPHDGDEHVESLAASTVYTAACRSCGRLLHLADDELVPTLNEPPICWACDDRNHPAEP